MPLRAVCCARLGKSSTVAGMCKCQPPARCWAEQQISQRSFGLLGTLIAFQVGGVASGSGTVAASGELRGQGASGLSPCFPVGSAVEGPASGSLRMEAMFCRVSLAP